MSQFTLKYWNGRGLMEVPRMLLAINGKFPGDYVDGRFSDPPSGLEANLGRMPILSVGDDSIGQSAAINFFVAAENGLLGSSNLEAAQIIAISEHLKEMMTTFRTLIPYASVPTEEQLDTWFTAGAEDVEGTADRAGYSTRYLKWWLGRIERVLGSSGFAVGTKLSLADVLLYNTFAEYLKDEESAEGVAPHRKGPFGSKERMDAYLPAYPKIAASCAAVASNENVQKWLATRGVQGF